MWCCAEEASFGLPDNVAVNRATGFSVGSAPTAPVAPVEPLVLKRAQLRVQTGSRDAK